MRKLKLTSEMTVDGYVAGPNGEMDWTVTDWDEELIKNLTGITESFDCIVLGRKAAQDLSRIGPMWLEIRAILNTLRAGYFQKHRKSFLQGRWTGLNGRIPFWQKVPWLASITR